MECGKRQEEKICRFFFSEKCLYSKVGLRLRKCTDLTFTDNNAELIGLSAVLKQQGMSKYAKYDRRMIYTIKLMCNELVHFSRCQTVVVREVTVVVSFYY